MRQKTGVIEKSLLFASLLMVGGCISVKAPDKPIEINLNVNVRQEVVVHLQKDAGDFIQNNPELFPQ
ncbi:YnbE family lipoprotein [Zymomonas mobilis subsp. mobilis ZM4 = ATCC 31821]|uniref:YnbE-like lipoprotein n=2 Tax=Zymomonas mobilis subsp. mobilis TaxID=120045 RepID=Q5NPS1_ZYMMO|nr:MULTISPECIES: YnbE family lipoprotein [Zymomonas]AAV89289.1 conserved hypothetical protein [Zymomonas mobilis subsp. mobilis ZM4 = ATCC 31821]ACV75149.1 hypothetical protein Za10_0601 [Zymomonas mobilis subsp. mobilis NCIMB 11163]AEH62459.1 conserved hypothetical protein [Zymomonas mobilis subsp. mobilis ATCC 10988]AFN56511.1 hypothetical protein ZZ6_0614 [Zymomonas mobilis subsp. mobilis ATCC 29191]ART93099.1 YnbE family lipoprotein [Zymomonas mobilis subsp. mobilis]